jgi:hypothetical protein
VPVLFKKHVSTLVESINTAWGSDIAEPFIGGGTAANKKQREETLTKTRLGKTRVVVGIRSLLQLGINVPAWDTIYEIAPISNAPNLIQELGRIRTPDPKNPDKNPIVRWFVDVSVAQSFGCFRSCVGQLRKYKEFSLFRWHVDYKDTLRTVMKGAGVYYGKDIDITKQDPIGINTKEVFRLCDAKENDSNPESAHRKRRM